MKIIDTLAAIGLVLILIAIGLTTLPAHASSLEWQIPVEREDNSALPISEISGYTIHYGKVSVQDNSFEVSDSLQDTIELDNFLTQGTYHIAMTTTDTDGLVSGLSNVIVKKWSPADLNSDELLNTLDVVLFIQMWESGAISADFTGDGTVNTLDIVEFVGLFNAGFD